MATYAIGDLQGCEREFRALLDRIGFSSSDRLWLLGDLVNRGPDSLGVLEHVYDIQDQCEIVLGNHDLHFLAIVLGGHRPGRSDTFDELLASPRCGEFAHWLRQQKLIHRDEDLGYVMVHAGVPPQWDIDLAIDLASEVESVVAGDKAVNGIGYESYFRELYGNDPNYWDASLAGMNRLRVITNYLTRMRLIDSSGALDFLHKGALADAPAELMPWYDATAPRLASTTLLFGHWAALDGQTGHDNVIGLDTGCVWGRKLTSLCLETGVCIRQDALQVTK